MAYCFEFVEKFRKDGNFCGLSTTQANGVENWSRFLSELAECGCDEKRTVNIITCSAYKKGRLNLLDRTTPLWRSVIKMLVSRIALQKPISGSELREYVGLEKMGDKELLYHLTPKGYSTYKRGEILRKNSLQMAVNKCVCRPPAPQSNSDRENRRRSIHNFCSAGQWNLLSHIVMLGLADDEYGAFCLVISWARDRPEVQKTICNGVIGDKNTQSPE